MCIKNQIFLQKEDMHIKYNGDARVHRISSLMCIKQSLMTDHVIAWTGLIQSGIIVFHPRVLIIWVI